MTGWGCTMRAMMRRLLRTVLLFIPALAYAQDPSQPPPTPPPETRDIAGTVRYSDTNEAVVGAVISVKGTSVATFADAEGKFLVAGAPAGPVTLVVSDTNGTQKEVPVGPDQTRVTIMLEQKAAEIITVVERAPVIVRTNLVNGASTVKGDDVNRVTADTVEDALQGKLAGANIQANSGAPGGGIQLKLRGVSTINGTNDVLYVIDGVILSNT